jgi:hypothetical protein
VSVPVQVLDQATKVGAATVPLASVAVAAAATGTRPVVMMLPTTAVALLPK